MNRVGERHLPISVALLQARARRIAAELGVNGLKGSPHFIQNWAARYRLYNVARWGQGRSANVAGAAAFVAEIRTELEAYPLDRIYNMDETGPFYRRIPNQAYVEAGRRRRARGTEAMTAKERVTLVLACNVTGTHTIPAAIIGHAEQPQCFKRPRAPCPLPCFSQKSAWIDNKIFKSWFETVFLFAVRARTDQLVVLISDNCASHEELQCDQVKFIALPPNCTAVYQPLDLGIIACLKRRNKRRLLDLVVGAFESSIGAYAAAAAAPAAQDGVAPVATGGPTAPPMATGATGVSRYAGSAAGAPMPRADTLAPPVGGGRGAPVFGAGPAAQPLIVGGTTRAGEANGTEAVAAALTASQPAASERTTLMWAMGGGSAAAATGGGSAAAAVVSGANTSAVMPVTGGGGGARCGRSWATPPTVGQEDPALVVS